MAIESPRLVAEMGPFRTPGHDRPMRESLANFARRSSNVFGRITFEVAKDVLYAGVLYEIARQITLNPPRLFN